MKVYVVLEWRYDDANVAGVYLIPDDATDESLHRQWNDDTSVPVVGRNQYGPFQYKTYRQNTKTFWDWIAEKFPVVPFIG